MPIYEYICRRCGAEFETLVSSAGAKVACPQCSNPDPERKLSVFSPASDQAGCSRENSCPAAGSHACGSGCCHGRGH